MTKSQIYFESHIELIPFHACWEWVGPKKDGYGEQRNNPRERRAHRYSYETRNGPIPKGLIVRHKCDNRGCVNPEHLELGTHADNVRDSVERKRQKNFSMTHCKNGHPFTVQNTRLYNGHYRRCRTCQKRWNDSRVR